MQNKVTIRDVTIMVAVALCWTLVVVGFSTSMGTRPLRIYDWGPPVFACLITCIFMLKDKRANSR